MKAKAPVSSTRKARFRTSAPHGAAQAAHGGMPGSIVEHAQAVAANRKKAVAIAKDAKVVTSSGRLAAYYR